MSSGYRGRGGFRGGGGGGGRGRGRGGRGGGGGAGRNDLVPAPFSQPGLVDFASDLNNSTHFFLPTANLYSGKSFDTAAFIAALRQLDGKPYPQYKSLTGNTYAEPVKSRSGGVSPLLIRVVHVQSDPYAPPGTFEVLGSPGSLGWQEDVWQAAAASTYNAPGFTSSAVAREAFADFLHRRVYERCSSYSILKRSDLGEGQQGGHGYHTTPFGGFVLFPRPVQQIVSRSAVTIQDTDEGSLAVVVRIGVSLPAQGRSIRGGAAADLVRNLADVMVDALWPTAADVQKASQHVLSAVRQAYLRHVATTNGAAAFIADGSLLARRAGDDVRPLTPDQGAIAFKVPPEASTSFQLPGEEPIQGLAFKKGSVNVLVGPGFHGKSTLLNALSMGAYNHIPGDGREQVVTSHHSAMVRSEDGRPLHAVDVSSFFNQLPGKHDTSRLSTSTASGSTSSAAALMESLEAWGLTAGSHGNAQGMAPLLLVDEDTCAANWLSRDTTMASLVPRETITPLVAHVRAIAAETGAAVVIVAGSSSAFLTEADKVIMMLDYVPHDVTEKAKSLPLPPRATPPHAWNLPRARQLATPSAWAGAKIVPKGSTTLVHGSSNIDLSAVTGIADAGQVQSLGALLTRVGHPSGQVTMADVYRALEAVATHCVDTSDGFRPLVAALAEDRRSDPFFVMPLPIHLVATLNRLRKAEFA